MTSKCRGKKGRVNKESKPGMKKITDFIGGASKLTDVGRCRQMSADVGGCRRMSAASMAVGVSGLLPLVSFGEE